MDRLLEILNGLPIDFANVYIALLRFAAPALMLWILWRAGKPLLTFPESQACWAKLKPIDPYAESDLQLGTWEDGVFIPFQRKEKTIPVRHWENVIGANKHCDIRLAEPCVAEEHAVLKRNADGQWEIIQNDSLKSDHPIRRLLALLEFWKKEEPQFFQVAVNGNECRRATLERGDRVRLGAMEYQFIPDSGTVRQSNASSYLDSFLHVLLLTLLQMLCVLAHLLNGESQYAQDILIGFGGICCAQWVLLVFYACIGRSSFEVETIAFFLCTMGMNAIAATVPGEAVKQLIAMLLGIGVFLGLGWLLRDMDRAERFQRPAAIAGVVLLLVTLVFGREIYGAKNWLILGGVSIQPSELVKLCFVLVGCGTLERIVRLENNLYFIAYSVILCGLLVLMNDFGTALIFFTAFLVIAYMRSGPLRAGALAVTAVMLAAVIALRIAPHALRRFETWRHIWEDPLGRGYQQTRSLMCMASGGLLGLGAGNGWMHNLFASDSDVVFATIAEEWGLIAALGMVAGVCVLAFFCCRTAGLGRNSFYIIGSCAAVGILTAQTILNVMGTVDLLPFTGVTFPFVSNGGSSMICAWGLMAYIKAADVRVNASFAIARNRRESQ